jgi:hypothetical protein
MEQVKRYIFELNSILRDQLIAFANTNFGGNLSAAVRHIFEVCHFIIKYFHFYRKPENGEYPIVGANCRLSLYIQKKFYFMLKAIHGQNNLFSMAVAMRRIIAKFLQKYNEYEDKALFYKKLKELNEAIKRKFERDKVIEFLYKDYTEDNYTVTYDEFYRKKRLYIHPYAKIKWHP